MKKSKIILSILVLALCLSTLRTLIPTAYAYDENANKVSVTAQGEVSVVPDAAKLFVGVETIHKNVATAQQQNAIKINNIFSILKQHNIPEENIKTSNFALNKEYDYSSGKQIFIGYRMVNEIEIQTTSLDGLSELLTKLLQNDANIFYGLEFTHKNNEQHYLIALKNAMENAKLKAEALLGHNNFKLAEISDQSYSEYAQRVYSLSSAKAVSSQISAGTNVVKANINVVFVFEN